MLRVEKSFNWGSGLFIIALHLIVLTCLPLYFYYYGFSLGMIGVAALLWWITGLSITAGYHRYYAHRTYKTNPFVESIILFFASMSGQGSALNWSYDHRHHHAFVDTDKDPHSIKKGFWYAHFIWIFEKPQRTETKIISDLLKNKLVMFQHHYYRLCMFGSNILVFLVVGWLLNDYVGAFVLAVATRMVWLYHFTWFINSLAHTWGEKPFSQEQTAVDNYIICLLTFGEGYHNYHHTFANDYRNGVRWYHFDPTKWLIWTLNKFSLAHDLRRMSFTAIKKRMVIEHKSLLMEHIKELWDAKKVEIETHVHDLSERLLSNISAFAEYKEKYHLFKKAQAEKQIVQDLAQQLKQLRKAIRADWHHFKSLYDTVEHLKTQRT